MPVLQICRTLIFFLALFVPLAAMAQPTVSSGLLGTATIDVQKPAASPLITLNIAGLATSIGIQYQSPSGFQGSEAFFASAFGSSAPSPGFTGKVVLQGYNGANSNGGVLSLYSEPGTWTLTGVSVCGGSGPCSQYNGASLQALFPTLTFNVVNHDPADITAPTASAASIKTRVVSIANGPTPSISVHASDDLSGVGSVVVFATLPNFAGSLYLQNIPPSRPLKSGVFTATCQLPTSTTPGTYTVAYVILVDIAGNVVYINDSATLAKLFGNKMTFQVTN
jgi:hypothetical protein